MSGAARLGAADDWLHGVRTCARVWWWHGLLVACPLSIPRSLMEGDQHVAVSSGQPRCHIINSFRRPDRPRTIGAPQT